jgi:SAM-dependent methyltransferase
VETEPHFRTTSSYHSARNPGSATPYGHDKISSMFTNLQYHILKRLSPGEPFACGHQSSDEKSGKLQSLLIREARVKGKTVIDFGCGAGGDAIEMAKAGAKRVIGLDIREEILDLARKQALSEGVPDELCHFTTRAEEMADLVVSVNAFEHFDDPSGILEAMATLLKPGGEVIIHFGPTWYHPLGGHLFSLFPWAHLIFSEAALIRWRSDFRSDGATRFGEVSGGLNQITIRALEKFVEASPLKFAELELIPIKKLRAIHCRLTREFTTSVVRSRLVLR